MKLNLKWRENWSVVRLSKILERLTRVTGDNILRDGVAEGHVGERMSKFNSR